MQVDWQKKLRDDLSQLPYTVTEKARSQLEAYVCLLYKWSSRINLTAVRSHEEMVSKHILDCLSIFPHLPLTLSNHERGPSKIAMIDVGTGAGLPGLPLAIIQPNQSWYLIDANEKKLHFVRHSCAQLEMSNIQVIKARVERQDPLSLGLGARQDKAIVSRAFAPVEKTLGQLQSWLSSGQKLYLMVGKSPQLTSIEELGFHCEACHPIQVPGLDADRHLCVMVRH